ncbi:MAG TPA: ATP synthase F1 subunit delta [Bacteroidota bacterium]|nr:ATP synthase F1 subunit delta [Bacteroidota bacterium]
MISTRVTRRYARALMDLAEEQKQLDRVVEDFELLQRVTKESKEFHLFLKSPVVKKEKKKEIFSSLFGTTIGPLTSSFVNLLIDKGREDILPQIINQFFALRDERLGIVSVEVKAAIDLTKDQLNEIRQRFEGITKKKVRVALSLDKQLKGGFLARVGDTVYDGSVRHQLELMRERFHEGTIHN